MGNTLNLTLTLYGVGYLAVDAAVFTPIRTWVQTRVLRKPVHPDSTLDTTTGAAAYRQPDDTLILLTDTQESPDGITVTLRGTRTVTRRAAWTVDQIITCRPCFMVWPTLITACLVARTTQDVVTAAAVYGGALALTKGVG